MIGFGFDNVIFPKNSTIKVVGKITSSNLLSLNIPSSVKAIRNIASPSYNETEITSPLKTLTFDKNSKLVAIYGNTKTGGGCDQCFIPISGQSYFSHAKLSSLSLPKSLKYIGDGAFANNSITSLNLPSNLKYIGDNSFENNSITSLNIPNSVEYLGDVAFKNNKISSLTFESGSELIYLGSGDGRYSEGNTFYGNQLTSVVLPPLIREIGKDSFGNNPNLKQITITGTEKIRYFDRNANVVELTDGQQLDVGTKDNPAYATIKYQK